MWKCDWLKVYGTDFPKKKNPLSLWLCVFQTASLLEEANKLRDENFLILHGTADGEILFTLTSATPCCSQHLVLKMENLVPTKTFFFFSPPLLSLCCVGPKRGCTSSTALSSWTDWWRWRATIHCSCTQMRATPWETRAASSISNGRWSTTFRTAWSKASFWIL